VEIDPNDSVALSALSYIQLFEGNLDEAKSLAGVFHFLAYHVP
jgi:hypothetical protein